MPLGPPYADPGRQPGGADCPAAGTPDPLVWLDPPEAPAACPEDGGSPAEPSDPCPCEPCDCYEVAELAGQKLPWVSAGEWDALALDGLTGLLGVTSGVLGVTPAPTWVSPPAAATDPGAAGQAAYDGSFLYVCVAASVWRRVALSSW